MKEFICQENGKLSVILQKQNLSYSAIQKLYRKKDIKINGIRISKEQQVKKGDKITLYLIEKTTNLDIVYQDENLVVLNKPQGIESVDFFNLVKQVFPTAYFTHRLDRNTGGLIIFALKEESYNSLVLALKNRTLNKYYITEVYGKVKKQNDTLVAYCKKDSKNSFVKVYADYLAGRQKMITEYKVLSYKENSTVLQVKLVTGRTHQIRCHLAFIGHFIIGDGKYGKEEINKIFKAKKQRLFAYKIEFNFSNGDFLEYLNKKEITIKTELA
ncbi:MAG: RluA family pseudouridine synthase [Clostridia bacterium]|nr:RluA family pseudouridine synthase [Clostridia bacterium]